MKPHFLCLSLCPSFPFFPLPHWDPLISGKTSLSVKVIFELLALPIFWIFNVTLISLKLLHLAGVGHQGRSHWEGWRGRCTYTGHKLWDRFKKKVPFIMINEVDLFWRREGRMTAEAQSAVGSQQLPFGADGETSGATRQWEWLAHRYAEGHDRDRPQVSHFQPSTLRKHKQKSLFSYGCETYTSAGWLLW